jgi:DNA-binding MarR family transcriptional regulator
MDIKTPFPSTTAAFGVQGCTNLKLRQMTRRISQYYDLELAKSGLKTTQYSLLSHVLKMGPVRPGDLARVMKMEPSTLTRNLKPLLVAGWVQLGEGADGRSRLVNMTESGRLKRQEAKQHWTAAQLSLNDLLGIDRVHALHRLIDDALSLMSTPWVEES